VYGVASARIASSGFAAARMLQGTENVRTLPADADGRFHAGLAALEECIMKPTFRDPLVAFCKKHCGELWPGTLASCSAHMVVGTGLVTQPCNRKRGSRSSSRASCAGSCDPYASARVLLLITLGPAQSCSTPRRTSRSWST